jgi:hypothetical protein
MAGKDGPGMNRRRLLNAAAGAAGISVAGPWAARSAASADPGRHRSAARELTNAVLAAFKTHRLVGLGEAHGLQNHHDLLGILLSDPRVPAVVDDIVVEFGNGRYQDVMDRFIAGQPVANADLRPVWRNTTQSPEETWDQPVYEQFFRTVRAANWALPKRKQMRVLLGDPPIDWPKITKTAELEVFLGQRDSHAASVVEQQVLAKGHRALLCYGMVHLFHPNPEVPTNLVAIIERRTGEHTWTIADLVPLAGDPGALATKLAPYPRNTAVPTAGTWLGKFDAGLLAPATGTRHGKPTNPFCGVPLGSLIDAGLYEGQPSELTASWWNPAIFLEPTYWAELQRRNALTIYPVDLNSYRQNKPAQYHRKRLPPSLECEKTAHVVEGFR